METDRRSSSASELPLLSARVSRMPSAEIWFTMLLLRAGEDVPDDIFFFAVLESGWVQGIVDDERVQDVRSMPFCEEGGVALYVPFALGFRPANNSPLQALKCKFINGVIPGKNDERTSERKMIESVSSVWDWEGHEARSHS